MMKNNTTARLFFFHERNSYLIDKIKSESTKKPIIIKINYKEKYEIF
jgi:hypothetical protein